MDIDKLFISISKREKILGWNNLSHQERIFAMIMLLLYEVGNGGLHQYYSNSAGDLAKHIPDALKNIKAFKIEKMIKKANSFFGLFGPSKNRIKRNSILNKLSNDKLSYMKSIDEVIFDGPEDIEELLMMFATSANLEKIMSNV